MSDERIAAVKKAFVKLDSRCEGSLSVEELISRYNSEFHPRVRTREKTAEQVQIEFERAIRSRAQDGRISEMDFLDYYADVSACLPAEREDHFINIIHRSWAPKGTRGDIVSTKRILDIENKIFEKIRQLTLPKENEGTTLKKRFAAIDKFGLGIIDFPQFRQSMHEIGFGFPDDELKALFLKFSGGNDRLFYSELCDYFREKSVGIPPNTNPAYTIYRKTPDDVLDRLRKELRSRGHYEIGKLRKIFETNDKDCSGALTRDEFVWVLKEIGLFPTKTEFDKLFRYFDRNADNKISYGEFVGAFVFDMNPAREQHSVDLFTRLAGSPESILTFARLNECFDPRNDPEVS